METRTIFQKSILGIAFVLGFCGAMYAQVSGKVISEAGNTLLAGVCVRNLTQNIQAISNSQGHYTITAKLQDTLEFSFVGHHFQKIIVTKKIHDIVLKPVHEEFVLECCEIQTDQSAASISVAGYAQKKSAHPVRIAKPTNYALPISAEEYGEFSQNKFRNALVTPLSTFSVDVDAASYSNVRRYINSGVLPPEDAIRSEELINYFAYDYPAPRGEHPVNIITEVSACPWNEEHRLVHIGLKSKEIESKELPASNLVFLIDVSGSMRDANKLPLLKSSMKLLVSQLRDSDKVAIVTYSGETSLVLPSTSGKEKARIIHALEQLQAAGYTAGGAGIKKAYQIARENFIPKGNNRVILATDGDFNVGISSEKELEKMIERERQSGVFLTVLGYGMGNYKDNRLQVLAQKGNGNHAYIDNLNEARKVLVSEFSGSMYTIARDVKLQIEFNPAQVQAYRLIGYESRLLEDEDFNDDRKDAGEIGIGHSVTALYEVIPVGVKSNIDPLKYQKQPEIRKINTNPELLTVKLRYKPVSASQSQKLEIAVTDKNIPLSKTSDNFRFSAAVAGFGMLLTHSPYIGEYNFGDIRKLAGNAVGMDPEGYRKEFIRMVQNAELLTETGQ